MTVTTTGAERRAERFARRQRDFSLAALLRMRRFGLSAVNLTDLAAQSDYSKGTWYNHFPSAEALYIEMAVVDADLHLAYALDIRDDPRLGPADQLMSLFITSVAHAMTHPEMWTLGVNARVWDRAPHEGVTAAVERLAALEGRVLDVVVELAVAAERAPRPQADTAAALAMVRAAADGLSILTTASSGHRWVHEPSTRESSVLLRAALDAAGFTSPTEAEMDALCSSSWQRVLTVSGEWVLPR